MVPRNIRLGEFAERYYLADNPHFAEPTRQKVRHTVNRWRRITADPFVGEITVEHLFQFRAANSVAATTTNSYILTLRQILRHAQRRGILETVPDVPRLREDRKLRPTPTIADIGRMYAIAAEARLTWPLHECPFRFWRRWLVVSYFTGLRLSDLMYRITWDCIRGNESLVVEARKTRSDHVTPLCEILRRHLIRRDAEPRIFPVTKSPHLVRRELRKLSDAAGASVLVTPHGIRRLSVTEWTVASDAAGKLVHGEGLGVRMSYAKILRILQAARENLAVPPEFAGSGDDRQLRLF